MKDNLENLPGWKVWCLEHMPYRMAIAFFTITEIPALLLRLFLKTDDELMAKIWMTWLAASLLLVAFGHWVPFFMWSISLGAVLALIAIHAIYENIYLPIKTVYDKHMEEIPERKDKKDE